MSGLARALFEQAAVGALVLAARALEPALGLRRLLRLSVWFGDLGRRGVEVGRCDLDPAALTRVERAAWRASRWVPGARCLHRAAAARVWLGWQGQDARLIVGLRRQGALGAHAWIELGRGSSTARLLLDEDVRFSATLDEARLLQRGHPGSRSGA